MPFLTSTSTLASSLADIFGSIDSSTCWDSREQSPQFLFSGNRNTELKRIIVFSTIHILLAVRLFVSSVPGLPAMIGEWIRGNELKKRRGSVSIN